MGSWTRKTVEGPSLTIEDSLETDNACVIEGSRHLHVLKHDRREAAAALAGDAYRVVPARDSDDGWIAVQRDEYEQLREQAAGQELDEARAEIDRLRDRDQYPRVQGVCPSCGVGPLFRAEEGLITCSWVDCEEPDAAANLLDSPPAQPDRPEPVDPASVHEGDHVEVTYLGWVDNDGWVRSHEDDSALLAPIDSQADPKTVRVLHRAEPEPDLDAVQALTNLLHGDVDDQLTNRDVAERLAKRLARHGVHVEARDAD